MTALTILLVMTCNQQVINVSKEKIDREILYSVLLYSGLAHQNILLQDHRLDPIDLCQFSDCRHDLAHLSLLGLPEGTQLLEVFSL